MFNKLHYSATVNFEIQALIYLINRVCVCDAF